MVPRCILRRLVTLIEQLLWWSLLCFKQKIRFQNVFGGLFGKYKYTSKIPLKHTIILYLTLYK